MRITYAIIALILSFTSSLFACRIWAVITKSDAVLSSLSEQEYANVQSELNTLYEQSAYQPNGWALLGYGKETGSPIELLHRSAIPAIQDSENYWATVNDLITEGNRSIGIGHIRMASSGTGSIPNPHPWLFETEEITYSLAHNGTISKSMLYNLITEDGIDISWLEKHPPQTFGGGDWKTTGWASVVDSELILLLIMKHIDIKKDVKGGLKSALRSIRDNGVNPYATNIVFSNGKTLYVYGGQNGLSFAESSEHISVMSRRPPTGEAARLNWQGIKNGELLVINHEGLKRFPNFTKDEPEVTIQKISPKVYPAFPNPFNNSVSIQIELPDDMTASYEIFNILGEKMKDGRLRPGVVTNHTIQWTPEDMHGNQLPSGSYFLLVSAGQDIFRQKVLYLK